MVMNVGAVPGFTWPVSYTHLLGRGGMGGDVGELVEQAVEPQVGDLSLIHI